MALAEVDFNSIISKDAAALVDAAPAEEEMEGHAQQIRDEYLKGLRFKLDHANLEDSTEFMREVMANVSESQGRNMDVSEIANLSTAFFEQLQEINGGRFLEATTLASSQAGLDVASDVYGESLQVYGLTARVLEDGKLSTTEAIRLGASATSMASTLIAGFSGGAAFGPLGAIAGLVIGGISFMGSQASAQQARWEAREAAARAYIKGQEAEVNSWLAEQKAVYEQVRGLVWQAKDTAIAEVADAWASFEDGLGVRFGLRYFPGELTPPRAGYYKNITRSWESGSPSSLTKFYRIPPGYSDPNDWVDVYLMCESLSGCLYFQEPNPSRVAELVRQKGETEGTRLAVVEMLEKLASKNKYLTRDPANLFNEVDYTQPRGYNGLSYFNRTIRAFDSFTPDLFWRPPAARVATTGWKKFNDLAFEWYQGYGGSSFSQSHLDCFERDSCNYKPNASEAAMAQFYAYGFDKKYPEKAPDIWKRAVEFTQEMHEKLGTMNSEIDVFKTRIMGDLVQTANAVGGELATSLRMKELFQQMGTSDIRAMSTDGRRAVSALDVKTMTALDKAKRRDGILNTSMLAAGVGAVGYGAYKKWGGR